MHSPGIKKSKVIGKSVLLLGIYLLHFILIQGFVAGFSDPHHWSPKTFFSDSHERHPNNSGIATFRTLEKHEVSKQEVKLSGDLPASYSALFYIATPVIDKCISIAYFVSPFHLSDASYRLYLRDRVIRI